MNVRELLSALADVVNDTPVMVNAGNGWFHITAVVADEDRVLLHIGEVEP